MQLTSSQHRGQSREERESEFQLEMKMDRSITSPMVSIAICVANSISMADPGGIPIILTARGMFGTYIRSVSRKPHMTGSLQSSPYNLNDKRVWAAHRVQDGGNYQLISFFSRAKRSSAFMFVLQQTKSIVFEIICRMYLYSNHWKAKDAAVDLLRHRQKPSQTMRR